MKKTINIVDIDQSDLSTLAQVRNLKVNGDIGSVFMVNVIKVNGTGKESYYNFKSKTISKYDINKDQSYSKVGYYLNSHWNIGMAYVMENCAKYKSEYYDIYKIKKWTTNGDS